MSGRYYFILKTVVLCLVITGCGSSARGLDAKIAGDTAKEYDKKCGEAFSEIKDANPKEFEALKESGFQPFDMSVEQAAPIFCDQVARDYTAAARKDNLSLTTYREIISWRYKMDIDKAAEGYERLKDKPKPTGSMTVDYLPMFIEKLNKLQPVYLALTGKFYGPQVAKLPRQ